MGSLKWQDKQYVFLATGNPGRCDRTDAYGRAEGGVEEEAVVRRLLWLCRSWTRIIAAGRERKEPERATEELLSVRDWKNGRDTNGIPLQDVPALRVRLLGPQASTAMEVGQGEQERRQSMVPFARKGFSSLRLCCPGWRSCRWLRVRTAGEWGLCTQSRREGGRQRVWRPEWLQTQSWPLRAFATFLRNLKVFSGRCLWCRVVHHSELFVVY